MATAPGNDPVPACGRGSRLDRGEAAPQAARVQILADRGGCPRDVR
jgi:hypothetical protein